MAPASGPVWPSAHEFSEAIQNPRTAFRDPSLRECHPAVDKLGLPFVTSGNFAYAFRLRQNAGPGSVAVRCFRGYMPDRDRRYALIDGRLDASPAGALAQFDFDAGGILVRGRSYPIVTMEWLDGQTLDLYVGQIKHNREAMVSLANQWLGVVESLAGAKIAHGDLQHGNVMVCGGQLRLIDFDGMYVPAMKGWKSSELGHQHYQHPLRSAEYFDDTLDRFSSLVIYLSVIALAEAPDLWAQFHDENLIFRKSDFVNPGASPLFARVRTLGAECQRLSGHLADAARRAPGETPDLLSLVERRSRLPAWMDAAPVPQVEIRTREVASAPSAAPLPRPQPGPSLPLSPVTAVAGGVGAPAASTKKGIARLFEKVRAWWFGGHGAAKPVTPRASTGVSATTVTTFGKTTGGAGAAGSPSPTAKSYSGPYPPLYKPAARFALGVQPQGGATAPAFQSRANLGGQSGVARGAVLVGSSIRNVYHLPTCEWALRIAHRNLINFQSVADARARGYRACGVCRP